jgi:serine phosphatase RsbU (regulator of sigma subunit)
MADSKVIPRDVPLQRLFKRQVAATLLQEFETLLPGGELTLVGADGGFFVGTDIGSQAQLAELLVQSLSGQVVRNHDLLVQPLLVQSQVVGALVARGHLADDHREEHVLACLGRSLTMLLTQALEMRELASETLDRYREINLLYDIGETIGGCLDPDELPRLVLGEAERIIQSEAGVVLLPSTPEQDQNNLEVRASFGVGDYANTLGEVWGQVVDQVYRNGRPAIVAYLNIPVPMGSILCAPLKAQEQVLGVILLGRQADKPEFTASDEKLLMALAGQAAIALETARLHQEELKRQRLEEELSIARQIQLSLLPKACPVIPGWEFAAAYRPARVVGGDLYDFFNLSAEPPQLGLIIADVTDKGVPAALFMAFSRTIIRTEAMVRRNQNPAATLKRANRSIIRDIQSDSRLFLSAFYATLDTQTGCLVYSSGGHNWPLWLRSANGEVQSLAVRGIMLGIFENIELEEEEVEVAPGDLLIFYTDGVTEARSRDGQLFDEERLRAVVKANREAGAQEMLQAVVDAVEAFVGDAQPSDDLTLLVVKRQSW